MPSIHSIRGRSLIAGALLWAAFPPLNWWPLAAVSVAILISMIHPTTGLSRGDYYSIWLGSSLCWLGLLQGIRLAYWPLHVGWIALSLYLAVYSVAFVGLSRVLVHRWRWPLVLAVPLSWVSLELARGYVITGFSGCLLGHVVAKHPSLIQVAAHFGTYGVSGTIVVLAVAIYLLSDRGSWFSSSSSQRDAQPVLTLYRQHRWQLVIALLIVFAVIGFGFWEVARSSAINGIRPPLFTAALIQENSPTIFDTDPERAIARSIRSWDSYLEETRRAVETSTEIDLVVWPESVFTRSETVIDWDRSRTLPSMLIEENFDYSRLEEIVDTCQRALDDKLMRVLDVVPRNQKENTTVRPYLLLGSDVIRIHGPDYERFNAALWVAPDGRLIDYYAKQHLVMFGEYIPFADYLPIIYRSVGMQPASAGQRAVSFAIDDKTRIIPSICFENVLPHVIYRQIQALKRKNESPDVMVNITNDGWFRGSSISDHHLANATLTSVENRRPMLVAANTGLSAWIDGGGNRVRVTPRLKAGFIIAKPCQDARWGLWQEFGDWPIRSVSAVCLVLWLWPRSVSVRQRSVDT